MNNKRDEEIKPPYETSQIGYEEITELVEKYKIDKGFDVGLAIIDMQNLITGINMAPLMPLKGEAKPRADKLTNGMYEINQYFNLASKREVDNYTAQCCTLGISDEEVQLLIKLMPQFKQAAINNSTEQDERSPRALLMDNSLKFSIIANMLDILIHSTEYKITSSGNDEHPTPAMKFCMEVLTLLNIHHLFTYSNVHNSIQKYKKL